MKSTKENVKGLVSLLIPCYNTGAIINRLLDSILIQDYPQVEVITVNDGSNDNSEDVIKSFMTRFSEKGYSLHYLYQENGGQSAAINNGLKYVHGEFLSWPDSDDFYRTNTALSQLVETLNSLGDDYAVVRSLPTFVDEVSLREVRKVPLTHELAAEEQFDNCIFSKNFFWPPGNYLIRMSCFDLVCKNRDIYTEKKAGQNWQMLLPLLYSYKCRTIEEHLFSVLIRSESHSRIGKNNYSHLLEQSECYKRTIINTLDRIELMCDTEREQYKKKIEVKYLLQNYQNAVRFGNKTDARRLKKEISNAGGKVSLFSDISFRLTKSHFHSLALPLIKRIKLWGNN